MEIFFIIVAIILIIILFSAKLGVGIRSSLINEIRHQCHKGITASEKSFPSISLEEAYEALSPFDVNNKYGSISNYSDYSFWVSVNGVPCFVLLKREDFKKTGIRLSVMRAEDYNDILRTAGMKGRSTPSNLREM